MAGPEDDEDHENSEVERIEIEEEVLADEGEPFIGVMGKLLLAPYSGCTENIVSKAVVHGLQLKTTKLTQPYKISWVKKGFEILVTDFCRVQFSIGKHYSCEALCDVLEMDVCHVILGRPWQFDVGVHYDGRANVYSMDWKGWKLRLLSSAPTLPLRAKDISKPAAIHFVSGNNLIREWQDQAPMFALLLTEPNPIYDAQNRPPEVSEFLSKYRDVVPDELPAELPPLRSIQHQIDFAPGATLPNLPHYRLNPKEQVILQELVDDLLQKQFIQVSLSPCAVPALLVPKKDG
ncbi:uncharacterized protein LOC110109125 [Dendrobium catenatum]|uniref:uncharacterized protein LOC110109125 n=1 Tax=Dendrobium catenatum TaxID=906689 RepID=UPI0009F5D5CE|nr:uncharacterized protein LOC110109125 [Dendrobium catenatum]